MAKYGKSMTLGVGDERPNPQMYIQDEKGNAVDLSGADSVDFHMYPVGEDEAFGTVKVDGAAAAIDGDGTAGSVTYTWASANVNTAGRFKGYFEVFWGASDTVPQKSSNIEINIKAQQDR
jgi:hypothetical protein